MNLEGVVVEYTLHFLFKVTNNQSKHEALLAGLKLVKELGVKHLRVFTDLQLVVSQVTSMYEAQDPMMARYLDRVRTFTLALQHFVIFHIL